MLTPSFPSSATILPNGERGALVELLHELPGNGVKTRQSIPLHTECKTVKKAADSPWGGAVVDHGDEQRQHQNEPQSHYRRGNTTGEPGETREEQVHHRVECRQGVELAWVSDRNWGPNTTEF